MSLTRKEAPFIFRPKQISAQEALKAALLASPALRPIDYTSPTPIILAIDTSHIAIGFLLCQCDAENPHIRRFARFGSITLNDHESRFSQPKLELYGLFQVLHSLKAYLISVRNLVVEVDARYIKGMLANADLAPSTSMNRWTVSILLFHFTLVHIPSTQYGPDGLSRRPQQPADEDGEPMEDLEFDDWVDQVYGFMHLLNPLKPKVPCLGPSPTYISIPISDKPPLTYDLFPQSDRSCHADNHLCHVCKWFETTECPPGLTNTTYAAFLQYTESSSK